MVPEPAPIDLNRSFFVIAARIRRRFLQRMADEKWAQEKGLRAGCFGVLRAIDEAGSALSQRQVSEEIGIDPSDVVALIDLLESAGFVERRRDARDRRRYALLITPGGRTALKRYGEISDEVEDEVFASLKPKDREKLKSLMAQVLESDPAELGERVGA